MNTGSFLVFAAFGATGAGLAAYLVSWLGGGAAARRLGRTFHVAATILLLLAAAVLMAAILNDDFSLTYVAGNSSRTMPVLYKISAFWAGQAGTVLLWALLQALVGVALLRRAGSWEPAAMSFLLVPQIFLMLLLVKLQPFAVSPAPPDGSGLNPLLLDPWMAIHPPIVFIGYAALAAPFALGLAAMATKRDDAWVPVVIPWVLLSVVTLGLGLFLGGFWAYKVLGWGGYWGWDPVENSSLAPWIVAAALAHGLLTQKATGALRRTNFALAGTAYALAVYSTYLTRSGVLANFSVHSFADGGLNTLLITMLAVTTLLPAVLLAARWRAMRRAEVTWNLTLQPMMALAVLFLMAGTALLVVGTSWPIISSMLGTPASPGPGFYNRMSLPVGIGLAALLAAAPLLAWGPVPPGRFRRALTAGVVTGLLAAILPPVFGLWPKGGVLVLVLLAGAVASLVASLVRLARLLRVNPAMTGAPIAHAGLALMLVGIVTTSAFDTSQPAVLSDDVPGTVLGHQMTLKGFVPSRNGLEPHFEVAVASPGGRSYLATPVMFRDTRRDTIIARPYIDRSLLSDLYIAPVSYQPPQDPLQPVSLVKGQPQPLGDATLTFLGFKPHSSGEGGFTVTAAVEVRRSGEAKTVDLDLTAGATGMSSPWVDLPLLEGASARLEGMRVESGTIHVTLRSPEGTARPAMLSIEVSRKPLINALWLGILVLTAGTGLAALHRAREARILATVPVANRKSRKGRAAAPPGMVAVTRSSSPKA